MKVMQVQKKQKLIDINLKEAKLQQINNFKHLRVLKDRTGSEPQN